MKKRTLLAVVCVCGLLMAMAAPAFAGTPAQSAYGGPCGGTNQSVCHSSSLPFTGINAGVVLALGAGLLGAGFAIRRTVRTSSD